MDELQDIKFFHNDIDCTINLLKYTTINHINNEIQINIDAKQYHNINNLLVWSSDFNQQVKEDYHKNSTTFYNNKFQIYYKSKRIYTCLIQQLEKSPFIFTYSPNTQNIIDLTNFPEPKVKLEDLNIPAILNNFKFIYDDKLDVTNDLIEFCTRIYHEDDYIRLRTSTPGKKCTIKEKLIQNPEFNKIYKEDYEAQGFKKIKKAIKVYFMDIYYVKYFTYKEILDKQLCTSRSRIIGLTEIYHILQQDTRERVLNLDKKNEIIEKLSVENRQMKNELEDFNIKLESTLMLNNELNTKLIQTQEYTDTLIIQMEEIKKHLIDYNKNFKKELKELDNKYKKKMKDQKKKYTELLNHKEDKKEEIKQKKTEYNYFVYLCIIVLFMIYYYFINIENTSKMLLGM